MGRDILSKIVATKKEEVAAARSKVPETVLREQAETKRNRRPFYDALRVPGPSGVNIIAEIKRASPSKGVICPDLDPAAYALQYERGGAVALSVLTDRDYFQGGFEELDAARTACSLPVLRKDFIISPYQVYETALLGADAMLLIVRILDPWELRDLMALAAEVDLDVLVEVHSPEELETASEAGARLVGVNNRNLKSFDTDIGRAADMASRFPSGITAVAESGIHSPADVAALKAAGIHNFLIGESIVRSPDPAAFIRSLMEGGAS